MEQSVACFYSSIRLIRDTFFATWFTYLPIEICLAIFGKTAPNRGKRNPPFKIISFFF